MIKRKINIILLLFVAFQWPACAITEKQAYIGSALFATAGALLTGKTENPAIILSTCALAGAAGYWYLRKYTPS